MNTITTGTPVQFKLEGKLVFGKFISRDKHGNCEVIDDKGTIFIRAGNLIDNNPGIILPDIPGKSKVDLDVKSKAPKPFDPTPLQVLCLGALASTKRLTKEIADTIGKPVAAANSALNALLNAGKVKSEKTDGGIMWEVVQ